ncbi:NLR family CARD domain-containing protein 3 [Nibea albiflora]|nr:NLR family CARD domain-containing protein 3 [Nibea albiflora]
MSQCHEMSSQREEEESCCPVVPCQDILKDLVFTSCGHWFCRLCIASDWYQSSSSGDSSCPQCGKRSRTSYGLQTASQTSTIQRSDETGSGTLLNRIYTELYIREGQSEEVDTQHEAASKKESLRDTLIKCHNIFKALPDQQRHIRVILMNGVAGIGKTFSVLKFTLDWAEGSENQDVSLVVLLLFRQVNLIKDERFSLFTLLHVLHPTIQKVTAEKLAVCKLLFIFDGLDETTLSTLDFNKEPASVLVTNLIMLPSVFIWITSRPAATNQIPPSCADRTKRKKKMYNEGHEMSPQELTKADREVLLKLGRLAFEQLEKGNIMLYQEDLEQCGLDVTEASVFSGVFTKIFKRESVMFQKTVYCFVHQNELNCVPDFLAAVYLFHCYTTNNKTKVLKAFLKDFLDVDSQRLTVKLWPQLCSPIELDLSYKINLKYSEVTLLSAGLSRL